MTLLPAIVSRLQQIPLCEGRIDESSGEKEARQGRG
jgi:hypothetical protein